MKKKLLAITLFILLGVLCLIKANSQTPDWVWARSASSSGTGEGFDIATDNTNNVFITGGYVGSITFGSTLLTGGTNSNVFLAKYDSYGNVRWAKTDSGGNSNAYCVATDPEGNSYITGAFHNTVSFGSQTFTISGYGVFLAKYDSLGNVIWARSAGGLQYDLAFGVATDTFGNAYVTGYFNSSSFTIGSFTLSNAGINNIFIAKYDTAGNVLWAKSAGGAGYDHAYSIATDASGNAYITGSFSSATITFGTFTLTNAGQNDIFLAKYDSSGNALWAKSAGGTSNEGGYFIATDESNNVYLTGYYVSPSITFGAYSISTAGGEDAFLVKFDSSGTALCAKDIRGSTGINQGWCVTTDKFGKVYLTGGFSSPTLTFDTIMLPLPTGSYDATFIAGYDSSGNTLFAKALTSGGDDENGVATSPSGCIYIGGDFEPDSFIVGNDTLIRAGSNENVFLAKLCYPQIGESVSEINNNNKEFILYPNPASENTTIDFTLPKGINTADIVLYNLTGTEIKRYKVDNTFNNLILNNSDLKAGTYLYELVTANGSAGAKKMVVIK